MREAGGRHICWKAGRFQAGGVGTVQLPPRGSPSVEAGGGLVSVLSSVLRQTRCNEVGRLAPPLAPPPKND